ncbi:hypothetical protein, partial [Acinetobacter sp. ANC5681]|uniref:hypothetical protein n=1 Tax=Acinetobacter sp. ANC5681 TaxID=2929504 RepID=UPI00201A6450
KFTKPLTIDEIEQGQDVFLIQPHAVILQYKYSEDFEELVDGIRSGFAQRDYNNALLQYRAFCRAVGATPLNGIEVVDVATLSKRSVESVTPATPVELDDILGPASGQIPTSNDVEKKTELVADDDAEDKPKKRRGRKTTKEVPDIAAIAHEHNKDLIIDAIATCTSADEVNAVCYKLDDQGFNNYQLQEIERAKTEKLAELESAKTEAETQATALLKSTEIQSDSELSVLCDAFILEINSAISVLELKAIHKRINNNPDLTEVENAELATRINLKTARFIEDKTVGSFQGDKSAAIERIEKAKDLNELQEIESILDGNQIYYLEAYFYKKRKSFSDFDAVASAAVNHAQKLDTETQQKNDGGHYFDQIAKENAKWKEELNVLLERLKIAKNAEEANALVQETTSWTKEQREPLLRAISRRLQEIENPQPPEPPSLLNRITNAQDLTELDALEIDVAGRHKDIQPVLMAEVKKRRLILEGAVNDEALP